MNPRHLSARFQTGEISKIAKLKQCSAREYWGSGGEVPRIPDFSINSRSSWDID